MSRPRKINESHLQKLEYAVNLGCNKREACRYAKIPESTFYEYVRNNPEFSVKIERWQLASVLQARMTVCKALETDANLAWKYLQKKRPEEFGTNVEVTYQPPAMATAEHMRKLLDAL